MKPFQIIKITAILLGFIFFCSCNRQMDKNGKISNENLDSIEQINFEKFEEFNKIDSLRDPAHWAYMSDLPLKTVAKLILSDSIEPSDNKFTFALLDTIFTCDKTEQNFYLNVFDKIMRKSDGVLSEAIGSYTYKFIQTQPINFLKHLSKLEQQDIKNWARYTTFEMYYTFPEDSLVFYCEQLIDNLKVHKQKKGLDLFDKEIKECAHGYKELER